MRFGNAGIAKICVTGFRKLGCHAILYFIFDAYAILIQSSNELALVQFTIVGLSHCQHFYADHGTELEMLEFI